MTANQTLLNTLGVIDAAFYQLENDKVTTMRNFVADLSNTRHSFWEIISSFSKDVDGILGAFYLTMDRKQRFDYTYIVWSEDFFIISPVPGEENRLFAFIGPFQPMVSYRYRKHFHYSFAFYYNAFKFNQFKVWTAIFLSLLAVICTMTYFTWLYNRRHTLGQDNLSNSVPSIRRSNFTLLGSHMIYVMNTMTNQGEVPFTFFNNLIVLITKTNHL